MFWARALDAAVSASSLFSKKRFKRNVMLCQPHREAIDEKGKEKRIPDEPNPRALAKNLLS